MTYLRTARADFRTAGSLSEMNEAIWGMALGASHAPMPDFFRIAAISSREPCLVFATFDLVP